MDYEKKYKDTLEKARQLCAYPTTKPFISDLQDLFPELKESEDKKMIQYFKDLAPFDKADELYEKYGFSHKDALAWLEKQAEQKLTEWSEEDEEMIGNIIDTINMSIEDCDVDDIGTKARFSLEKERDWLKNKLKSLRPQNRWKPSDEQMKALKEASDEHWEPDGLDPLYTLYQDLKKLREE